MGGPVDFVEQGRFQAAETKIEAGVVEERAREADGGRVARAGRTLDGRAARVAEAEEFGPLVKASPAASSIVEPRRFNSVLETQS